MTTPFMAVATLLASTSIQNVHVGDQADFTGSIQQSSASTPVTLSMKVKSFDAANGKYVIETTQTVMGQTQTAVAARAANEIGDDVTGAAIVSNCEAYGGARETVTIPSEVLSTCRITQGVDSLQTINIGAVPFMIVKYVDASEGVTTTLNLSSYKRGQ